jgi:hypothetical protein
MFRRLDTDGMDFMYAYIWDRSRAVRKDLSVGAMKPGQEVIYIECVEMCIRFHLLTIHQMALGTSPDYNHELDYGNDIEQLRNCYVTLRQRYPEQLDRNTDPPNRAEFIAYDIILSLKFGAYSFKHDEKDLRQRYNGNMRITTALAIAEAYSKAIDNARVTLSAKIQGWTQYWRLIKSPKVSYLMACAAEFSFNEVRFNVLFTIRAVYRPRPGKPPKAQAPDEWTLERLLDPLGFDTLDQVREFCEALNFTIGENRDGVEYLDLSSFPASLPKASSLRQYHSANIVEPKRNSRTFAAVIEEADTMAHEKGSGGGVFNQDSAQPSNFFGTLNGSPGSQLNPSANSFAPQPTPNANPFLNNAKPNSFANVGQFGGTSSASNTPASVQPGLFDASKNSIQFAPSPNFQLNGTPVSSATSDNPFKSASMAPAAQNPFAPAATSTPPFGTNTSTAGSNPFAPAATSTPSNPFAPAATFMSTPSMAPPFGTTTSTAASANAFAPIASAGPSAASTQPPPVFNFTPHASPQPTPAFNLTPPPPSLSSEDEQRKAEQHKRIDDERRAREEQERQAREAVAQRRREAEQERQRQIQEEQQRKAQAERERQAELERLRQSQLEAERRAQEERVNALNTCAVNLLMGDRGLMEMYIENRAQKMFERTKALIEEEELYEKVEEMYHQKQLAKTRKYCAKWYYAVQKKKKKAADRRRREELKALRDEAQAFEKAQAAGNQAAGGQTLAVQPVASQSLQKTAPPSKRVENGFRIPDRPVSVQGENGIPHWQKKSSRRTRNDSRQRVVDNTNGFITAASASTAVAQSDYSDEYYRSTAPQDRTETDWFRLRAMGIDPAKHRKRSFGGVSGDDEVPIVEKRARRSTSSSVRHSLPPPSNDDELIARFNAVRTNKGKTGGTSFSGNRSVNGSTSAVVVQAREVLANSPTPGYSPPASHHKYSRSMPGGDASNASPGLSMFGRSIGAALPNERPAFYDRPSRFVPQHLYGKGPEAIRAYREQLRGSSRTEKAPVQSFSSIPIPHKASMEAFSSLPIQQNVPLELSSPLRTQQSYIPTGETQHIYERTQEIEDDADGEDGEEEDFDEGFDDDEDDESVIDFVSPPASEFADDEEGADLFDGEQYEDGPELFEEEYEEEGYGDEDGESEMSEELSQQSSQQFAQQPGGTQDDAIELSD